MTTRGQIVSDARLAGQVQRYHTWPTLRDQSNGEHTWQVMRIYWSIFGPMSPEVSTYVIFHDAGELGTGDLPFPTKSRDPELKSRFDRMEADAVRRMMRSDQAEVALAPLPDGERLRVKLCDLIDMWEFGMQELGMGNRLAEPIVADTQQAIEAIISPGEDVGMDGPSRLESQVRSYMSRRRAHHV